MNNFLGKSARKIAGLKFSVCSGFIVFEILATLDKTKGFDMIKTTVSAIGRTQPLWFLFWGILTSVTVLLNLFFICERLKVGTSLVYLMIVNCGLSFMLPTIYIGNGAFSVFIHGAGVAVFGALGYGTLIYSVLGYFKKSRDKKGLIFFFSLTAVLTAAAVAFAATGFNGLVELILLIGAEVIMLVFNIIYYICRIGFHLPTRKL
jgi:hypothetical protein